VRQPAKRVISGAGGVIAAAACRGENRACGDCVSTAEANGQMRQTMSPPPSAAAHAPAELMSHPAIPVLVRPRRGPAGSPSYCLLIGNGF